MHLSRTNGGVLSAAALAAYLEGFEAKARAWPSFISTAFPRFNDFYAQGGGEPGLGSLEEAGGQTFRETLSRALTNGSFAVQIATWNDFGEGTMIEPTRESGYRDLAIVRQCRRAYSPPGFRFEARDLELPLRLFRLRRSPGTNPAAELDAIVALIQAGDVVAARQRLELREGNAGK